MRGRGPKSEGRWVIAVAPDVERAIIRDYCDYSLSLVEVAVRHGVTEWTVNKIRLRWGLRRYRTNADPRVRTVRQGEIPLAPLPSREPTPKRWRCRCGGPADSPDGHERCRAA